MYDESIFKDDENFFFHNVNLNYRMQGNITNNIIKRKKN